MVIVICSYNNADWVETNLDSVFSQKYNNFRVLYVDDASQDGTPNTVENYIHKHHLHNKITVIRKNHRCRKMKNMYQAFHACKNWEIIVQLDGDDWFAHQHVLSLINDLYTQNDIWIAYSQFKFYPSDKIGYAKPVPQNIIDKNNFRAWHEWVYMGTRSFYAWLFKCINLDDLLTNKIRGYKGKFYPASNDAAIMMPMLEMAHHRLGYIPEVTYIYNQKNPLNGNKVDSLIQRASITEIFLRQRYKPLKIPLENHKSSQIDILICSTLYKNLEEYLNTLLEKIHGFNKIFVIYESDSQIDNKYYGFKKIFPNISFINIYQINLNNILQKLSYYVLLLEDKNHISAPINLKEIIDSLDITHAYGFYLDVKHCNKFISEHIYDNIFAWKFSLSSNKKKYIVHKTSHVIYRKTNISHALSGKKITSINSLKNCWQKAQFPLNGIGLYKN